MSSTQVHCTNSPTVGEYSHSQGLSLTDLKVPGSISAPRSLKDSLQQFLFIGKSDCRRQEGQMEAIVPCPKLGKSTSPVMACLISQGRM